jgi:hypothetical protein
MSDTSLPPFLESLVPDSSVPYINALFPASDDIPPVHVHWWPCKQAGVSPSTVLLFIPGRFNINELSTSTHELITGNPGVINFYLPFLTAVHHKDKSGTLAILSHSHVGHDPEIAARDLAATSRNPFIYALSFQFRNTLRVFDALSTWFGINTRIVVIGHSVGAWLALQVAFP